MNESKTDTTNGPTFGAGETAAEKLTRLRRAREEREGARDAQRIEREIEKEELLAKYEAELGPRGSEFELIDTGFVGDTFVVVKKPLMVQWTKYSQSKLTPTDQYDFVAPCVVYPSLADFGAFREKRVAIDDAISKSLQKMMALNASEAAGK